MIRALLLFCFWAGAALALNADVSLPDPAQEARAQALFHELRCMVCGGETIADSPAAVASDMRREVRAQVASGSADAAILALFKERYGEVVLARPPLSSKTFLLWALPVVLPLFGFALWWRGTKK